MDASTQVVIDTNFRSALRRMQQAGRIDTYSPEADPEFQIAGMMKKLDGGPSLLFPRVKGHSMPVLGNMLSCRENCEAAFGVDYKGIRQFVARALGNPVAPVLVTKAPVHENVHREFDLGKILPILRHTDGDSGRFITAGIVIVKDPETGVYNASYHRLQLIGPKRTAIKLDFGRHLRAAYERAQKLGKPLSIAVCIGTDLAVHYTAATMGAQMPESADELAIAGGLHRFHAVIAVRKSNAMQEGMQRNAILAAFGTLKDLDLVIAVDDDIDIKDPNDVEYALAMRMEASKDLFIIPGARTHEYVRKSNNGIRAKMGIDATVPVDEKERFARAPFRTVEVDPKDLTKKSQVLDWLK